MNCDTRLDPRMGTAQFTRKQWHSDTIQFYEHRHDSAPVARAEANPS